MQDQISKLEQTQHQNFRDLDLQQSDHLGQPQSQSQAARSTSLSPVGRQKRLSTRPNLMTVTEHHEDKKHTSTSTTSLPSMNAEVSYVTSPSSEGVENILTRDPESVWFATGLYPELIQLQLRRPVRIDMIELCCSDITELAITLIHSRNSSLGATTGADFQSSPQEELEMYRHRFDFSEKEELCDRIEILIRDGTTPFCRIHSVMLYGPED